LLRASFFRTSPRAILFTWTPIHVDEVRLRVEADTDLVVFAPNKVAQMGCPNPTNAEINRVALEVL
jgi:hypothetical protein